jgi:hypothetical protein
MYSKLYKQIKERREVKCGEKRKTPDGAGAVGSGL